MSHFVNGSGELSAVELGIRLIQSRWRIATWMIIGGAIAALSVITRPSLYEASASFVPEGVSQSGGAGLAGIAGQLGVSLPSSDPTSSPDFYATLLESRAILTAVVRDTLIASERADSQFTFIDLFDIEGATHEEREGKAITALRGMQAVSIDRSTGVLNLAVATPWRSVSLQLVSALIREVSEFNQRTRRSEATAEREFLEARLNIAERDLRAAEERLESFLKSNRQFSGSPELIFAEERIEREITHHQQVYTALMQAQEEVRLREVRNTPLITMVEAPAVPTHAKPRGRLKRGLLGVAVGGLLAAVVTLAGIGWERWSSNNEQLARELRDSLGGAPTDKRRLLRIFQRRPSANPPHS